MGANRKARSNTLLKHHGTGVFQLITEALLDFCEEVPNVW